MLHYVQHDNIAVFALRVNFYIITYFFLPEVLERDKKAFLRKIMGRNERYSENILTFAKQNDGHYGTDSLISRRNRRSIA